MVAAHATVPEAGGDCTWPRISGYGHGNTAVTRRGRPSRPGWPHRCQRLPNLRSRTFRCTCRALSPYQPFGCAFGARSVLGGGQIGRPDMRVDRGQTERCSPEGNHFASDSSHPKHQAGQQTADSRQNPTDCVPRAREPGPPESRWPLERRRKGTAAGVIYRLRARPGPCGGRRCRLRQAALVGGDGPVVGPGRRPPGLLVCLVTGDTGRVSPRPPVHRSPIAWDRAGASCGTRSAARSNRRGSE